MTAPIVYKSTDANAPVLSGTAGALVALLEACLVTGYGDKPGAGWTVPFKNARGTLAAFRNAVSGTGFYLQVDHGLSLTANTCRLQCYELMTAEDAGSLQWASTTDQSEIFRASATVSTTPRPWVVIATPSWVFFCGWGGLSSMPTTATSANGNTSGGVFFFGDFTPYAPSDGYPCFFGYGYPTSSTSAANFGFGASKDYSTNFSSWMSVARPLTGVAGGVLAGLAGGFTGGGGNICFGSGVGHPADDPAVGVLLAQTIVLGETNKPRGYLPGIYAPMANHPWDNLEEFTGSDGRTYLYVIWRIGGGTTGTPAGLVFCISE